MNFLKLRVDVRIALLYAAFGGVWVFLSDSLLSAWVTDPAVIDRLQTYKGWAFVAASALVIFLLLRRELIHRKITEGKLGETEELYRQLFEHSMDAILLTSPDGSIHAANPAACRMFGRTEEEIKRLGRDKVVDVTDPRLKPALEERARTGRFHGELTHIRRDGSKFPGEVSTNLFKSRDGQDRTSMIIRDVTERKRIQEALQKGEERYRLISSLASDYMFYSSVDDSGQLQLEWVAGAFEAITGYTLEEYILHGGWRATVHPDDLEVDDHDMEKLREGRRVITEIRTITKSGGTRWVQIYAQPVLHPESGQLIGIHGAVQEITERKKAEQALHESQNRLKIVLNNAPIVLLAVDRNGIFTLSEGAGLKQSGLQPGQVVGLSAYDLYGGLPITLPDGRNISGDELLERVFAGETVIASTEFNGVHFENRFAPLPDQNGEVTGMVGVSIDVTERKQTEEALRKSEELYRKLTENFPNGTVNIYDRDLRMTFVGGGDLKKYNRKPEEFIGRTFQELAPPETFEIARLYLLAAFEGKTAYYETPYWGDRYYLVNVAPLQDADGSIREIMVVTQNMSERKRAEEELRLSRDRLTELTRRLVETRESEARAIGRELHDQIGQMLTALKITLDLAGQLPAEAASKKIEQAQGLTAELLDRVSRLSLELRPPMLDDLGLIPALIWHVNQYQEATGIQVDFKHSSVEGRRFASEIETTAYRTVQEALTNAARHARAHKIRLEVRAGGGWMELLIEDDGTGVDAKSALGKNRGLSGMRERARLVGGTFEIESETGKGTKIMIRLPVQEDVS